MNLIFTSVVLLIFNVAPIFAAELYFVREDGCPWCDVWTEEVGIIYHKTEVGKSVPLRTFNFDEYNFRRPILHKAVSFTPTFILVDKGHEIGRIVGFSGEYQFWGLLDGLLRKCDCI